MLFDLFNRLKTYHKLLVAMTLWSIWKSRNAKLWDAANTSPTTIATCAKDTLNEWSCMKRAKAPVQNEYSDYTWTKPPLGMIKCNVDSASFNNNTIMGYNICFRDFESIFVGKIRLLFFLCHHLFDKLATKNSPMSLVILYLNVEVSC